jgi:YVTN family beta-propeller protein
MSCALAALALALSVGTALGPTQGTLIVLDKSDATASLIDPATGDTALKLPTGVGPHEVAVSPDGRTAVVCDYGAQTPGSTLTVIDLAAGAVVRTIDLGEYRRPHGIEYQLDGKHVLVTVEQNQAILRVDVAAGKVAQAFETKAQASHMVVLAPDGARAFVANIASGSVTVIDLESGAILAQIPTGAGAEGIAVTPDGKEVWVSNRSADTLSVIDAEWLEVRATPACAKFPIRIEITPDGKHALVSNANSGDVAVFDVAARRELARVPMQLSAVEGADKRLFGERFGQSPVPVGIQITPDGARAFVANTNADLVTVLDLATWKIAGRIVTGREPDGMAWSPLAPPSAAKPSTDPKASVPEEGRGGR